MGGRWAPGERRAGGVGGGGDTLGAVTFDPLRRTKKICVFFDLPEMYEKPFRESFQETFPDLPVTFRDSELFFTLSFVASCTR